MEKYVATFSMDFGREVTNFRNVIVCSVVVIAYIIILSKTDRINYIQYHSNRVIFIILIILVYIDLYFAQSK